MNGMDSEGESDLFPMIAPPALPTFDLALRGYDKRQVDEYLDRLEHDLSVAQGDRDAASARIALTEKRLDELENELQAARAQLTEGDRPTYKGLGKRVEQLLTIAEEEAERLRADAVRDAAEERAAAGTLVQQAQEEADEARREFEADLDTRRRKAQQQEAEVTVEVDKRLAAAEKRIADADAAAKKRITDAEQAAEKRIAGDRAEADRMVAESTGRSERMRKDAEQHATALIQAAKHDVEQIALEAKSQAETIITEARAKAEQGRAEHDREIAALIQRRHAIRDQLKALRHSFGMLPDTDLDDNDHTAVVTPPEETPENAAEETAPMATSEAAEQQTNGQGDRSDRPEQANTNDLFRKIGT